MKQEALQPAPSGGSGVAAAGAPERFLALDAMRGVAAIAVLLIHIGFLSGHRGLAPFGFLAVDLFFVISGFVVGCAYEPRLLAGMARRRFMALRLVRLYPALLLGLLLGILANQVAPGDGYTIGWQSLGHFLLVPDFHAAGLFPLNGVFWSLFFELAINAVHALFVRRLTTPRLAVFVLASGLAWALIATSLGDWGAGWNGSNFTGGIARVGWGYGVGLLIYRLLGSAPRTLPRLPFLIPVGAAALLLLAPRTGWPLLRNGASVFLLFPLIVLLGTASRVPPAARGLADWLAAVSYPLYAVHLPFLVIAAGLAEGPLQWAAAGLACLLFATAAAYWYELPLRRFLRARLASEPAGTAPTPPGVTVYSAASVFRSPGAFLAAAAADLGRSGNIAWRLFRSELRARRRQSLLGHAWLVLPAAATALVCTYLQRRGIVGLQETPLPYPLFVLSGVLMWQTFADALNAPLRQMTAMRQLITRSRVPHEAVMAAGAVGVALNAAIRLALLLLLLPLFGIGPAPSLLLLPLGFFALILLGLAVGLIVAPFGLLYEDVGRGLPLVILFWFFLTPIVYPVAAGATWLRLNPVSPLVETSRSWILGFAAPTAFLAVLLAAAAALAGGILFQRVARPHLIARLG